MSMLRFSFAVTAVALVLTGACHKPSRPAETSPAQRPPPVETPPPTETPAPTVVLPAPSTEPRYAVAIDDADEIAILTQRLKLRQVIATHGTLYFAADDGQLRQLRELGLQVTRVDPDMVDSRVLRVARRGSDEGLREAGVIIVTREPSYWIVSGTLAQLRRIVTAGYKLEPLAPGEPRPRWIRVVVTNADDLQRVSNLDVDIFSVADTAGRYTILGAALDMHIDRLREAGFTVVLLPTP
jgi:hypothetical protein